MKSSKPVLVDSRRLRLARREIREFLAVVGPKGIPLTRLPKLLIKRLGRRAPSAMELSDLITSVACVEQRSINRRIVTTVYCRDRPGDAYERVLRKAGRPMHFNDICAETRRVLVRSKPLNPKVVAVQLGADSRFTAMAHSGHWALSAWPDVETRKITDIAAAVLVGGEGPMEGRTLSNLIARRRPVAPKSVTASLHRDSRFKKVGRGIWTMVDRTTLGT